MAAGQVSSTILLITWISLFTSASTLLVVTANHSKLTGSNECTKCTSPCDLSEFLDNVTDCVLVNRTVPRSRDCPCCSVCARQSGQSCDDIARPCDTQLGLNCDNTTATCQGPFGLRATLVTHNSTVLQWMSNSDDGIKQRWLFNVTVANHLETLDNETDWEDNLNTKVLDNVDAIMVEGLLPNTTYFLRVFDSDDRYEVIIVHTKIGCIENGTSFGVGDQYDVGCELRCECSSENGGRVKCRDRCSTRMPSRPGCKIIGTDLNDECCKRFSCDDNDSPTSLSSSAGDDMARVLLTSRTPNSLTIAWDDFKVPGPNFEYGYVVEYRPSSGGIDSIDDSVGGSWNRIQVGNVPITTVGNLRPNTPYDVRVSIWEESKRMSTEVAVLYTEDGCVWHNESISVNDMYNQGCDSRCLCLGNDTSECGDRCSGPLRAASATLSDNCTVSPVHDDSCCVLVECPQSSDSTSLPTRTTRKDDIIKSMIGECPTSVADVTGNCRSTCKSDKECSIGEQKCCLTDCGSTACTTPIANILAVPSKEGHPIVNQLCSGRTCGLNAICQRRSSLVQQCRCLPGFTGDPYGIGCHHASKSPPKAGCTFSNATYLVGETFFDGCEYKCRCNNNEGKYEMLCQPRCLQREDKPRLLDPACQLKRDPVDGCCKILVCETASENDAEREINNSKHRDKWIATVNDDEDHEFNGNVNGSLHMNQTDSLNATIGFINDDSVNVTNNFTHDADDSFLDGSLTNTTGTRFVRNDYSNVTTGDDGFPERNNSFVMNERPDEDLFNSTLGNSTSDSKEVRRLKPDPNSQPTVLTASIQQILPIGPTNVRLQIAMSPSVMEMMFMDSDVVSVLYTNNLTSDLQLWDRHPLIVRHNVAFVTVDRSDTAVETVISDLEPNREYYFALVIVHRKDVDGRRVVDYQRLGDVEATVTIQLEEGACEFMGKTFGPGERLYDDCQAVCDCLPGQRVRCEALVCPDHIGPDRSGCLEWYTDSTFVPRAPHCCPDVACKYASTCVYEDIKFRNLEMIPRSLVPECDKECKCVAGNVTCSQRCPPLDVTVIEDCAKPILAPIEGDIDGCCKRWSCDEKKAVLGKTPLMTASTTVATTVTIGSTSESSTQDDFSNFTISSTNETAGTDEAGSRNVTSIISNTDQPGGDEPLVRSLECVYENQTYRVNEQWKVGQGHRQKSCTCVSQPDIDPDTATVECQGGCPPILTHHLSLIPDCPPSNVVIWDVPELCPYVVCNKTDAGRGVKNVTAVALNATSMLIDFVLPSIYVGLYGHAEILYTMDVTHNEDTTTWNKEVFSGPSNQFESARLTHEMNGMQPDTEYFLKVQVVIKNTKNVDSSDVITVRTPALPTTTTTTSTTTLPPKISMDARIEISDIQPTSVKVSWRAFDTSERRVVDGVQLQYRRRGGTGTGAGTGTNVEDVVSETGVNHDETFGQWSLTTLIHRDVTSYVLADLKPDSDYDVDLIFAPPANISTEVLSMNSAGFHTLPVHDDFEFNLTLTLDKVTSHSVELIWTGVPYPEQKYVNVYRIMYLQIIETKSTHGNVEPSYVYRPPKGNQFQFTVEGLSPSTNYTVWMEAYLINGRTRLSNNITVLTKLGSSVSKITENEKHESLGGPNANGIHSGSRIDDDDDDSYDYAAAFVVVAVIAVLVTLGFVVLLVILLKKQSSAKAPITTGTTLPAVKSHSAYDNPTYKTRD